MRDLLDILTATTALPAGEPFTLATVVRVDGSSYRSPGARMFVDAAGRRVGSVSGGCLESEVARRGRLLTADRPTALARFDSTDDDAVWGFGLGCNGAIDVLIERCVGADAGGLGFLRDCVTRRVSGSIVTLFDIAGDIDLTPGLRLFHNAETTIDPSNITARLPSVFTDIEQVNRSDRPATITYQIPGGRIDAFIEPVRPPLPVVIFGGGHDAVPLVHMAKSLGWHVTVWDRRQSHARPDRFPAADLVIASEPAHALTASAVTSDTIAVVMNHHYPTDAELVTRLLDLPARYVGVLGPRSRTDRIVAGRPAAENLFAPVGLDVGADGPEQVAVAVVAEIVAHLANRSGGPLRLRDGPIHVPPMVVPPMVIA